MPAVSEIPRSSRRERKKLQTRRALERAALRLVTERGLDGVTVEAIAEAVDVSPRTFFNYFASKEEALLAHDPGSPARLREAIRGRPLAETPLQSLRAVLCELVMELAGRREEWLQRRAVIRSDPRVLAANFAAWGAVERALVEEVAKRAGCDPERDLYPALVVSAAVSATRVAAMRWQSDDETPLAELVDHAFSGLAEGLPAPRAGRRGVGGRHVGADDL